MSEKGLDHSADAGRGAVCPRPRCRRGFHFGRRKPRTLDALRALGVPESLWLRRGGYFWGLDPAHHWQVLETARALYRSGIRSSHESGQFSEGAAALNDAWAVVRVQFARRGYELG